MAKEQASQGKPPGSVKASLLPSGLKEKLIVAFGLMSVVPLLILGYVVSNYVFPKLDTTWDLSLVVGLGIAIAFLGFIVARSLVLPVVKMAAEAQAIAEGHLERKVSTEEAPDEVGTLGVALNQITERVRDNMSQLRLYGEQTKDLNLEINRRIMTLSNLLQVSNLISQSAKIEEVIQYILQKLTQLDETELNCILRPVGEKEFVIQAASGLDAAQVQGLLEGKISAPWLRQALSNRQTLVIDGKSAASAEGELIQQLFGMTNAVCQPIGSMGEGVGVLVTANKKSRFEFQSDCLDILKVFAKQLTIAIENDMLMKRAEELKVIDELTGLYNEGYMRGRMEEEIRRAARYHRSCALALFNLDGYGQFRDLYGALAAEKLLHQIAELLKGAVTEVDRVGRIGADEFAVILPERNKREAIDLAEIIRGKVEEHVFMNGLKPFPQSTTVSGGVSENPIDGMTGDELFTKATEALSRAKAEGKNKILTA